MVLGSGVLGPSPGPRPLNLAEYSLNSLNLAEFSINSLNLAEFSLNSMFGSRLGCPGPGLGSAGCQAPGCRLPGCVGRTPSFMEGSSGEGFGPVAPGWVSFLLLFCFVLGVRSWGRNRLKQKNCFEGTVRWLRGRATMRNPLPRPCFGRAG